MITLALLFLKVPDFYTIIFLPIVPQCLIVQHHPLLISSVCNFLLECKVSTSCHNWTVLDCVLVPRVLKGHQKTAMSHGAEPTPGWVCCDITKVWFPHLQVLAITLYDNLFPFVGRSLTGQTQFTVYHMVIWLFSVFGNIFSHSEVWKSWTKDAAVAPTQSLKRRYDEKLTFSALSCLFAWLAWQLPHQWWKWQLTCF